MVSGLSFAVALFLLVVIFILGVLKSLVRLRAVTQIIPEAGSIGSVIAHATMWPLASLLYLDNSLAAAFSRKITWRGITYELKSPTETVIIRDDQK